MFKRLRAIFIAMILCLSLMAPALAASAEDDAKVVTIQNVEAGAKLSAYQIIAPVYDGKGNFVGWKWSEAVESNKKIETMVSGSTTEVKVGETTYRIIKEGGISLANVQAIINQGQSQLGAASYEDFTYNEDGEYTKKVNVGSYLVFVQPVQNNIKVYNPMIVSVDYSGDESDLTADAEENLNIGGETAYTKSSEPGIEKTVSGAVADTSAGTSSDATPRDYSIGDTINYVLTTTVPDYSKDYFTNPKFYFTDTMDESLTYSGDMVIWKPETTDSEGNIIPATKIPATEGESADQKTNYTITPTTDDGKTVVTVEFTPEFILANPNQPLEITYSAKLNDKATTGYNANTNTVVLTYSQTPTSTHTAEDRFRAYTFSINGTYLVTKAGVEGTITNYFQNNFIKTGEDGIKPVLDEDGNQVKDEETNRYQYTGGLDGAEFALYEGQASGTPIKENLKTTDGYLQVDGLKQGTYYLVETKAPDGYNLNTTPVKIDIEATYFANGNLQSYKITIDGRVTESYTVEESYEDDTLLAINNIIIGPAGHEPSVFKNIKLSSLPSTGSYGTYAFILIGCVIMAAALTMFVVKRKERS